MAAIKVESYNKKYLRRKPEVTQIFNDLEDYLNWVRLQWPPVPFDEADLYKQSSPLWQKYQRHRGYKTFAPSSRRAK